MAEPKVAVESTHGEGLATLVGAFASVVLRSEVAASCLQQPTGGQFNLWGIIRNPYVKKNLLLFPEEDWKYINWKFRQNFCSITLLENF